MTIKQGRLGRKYNRAAMADPRGSWAPGAPASAGFVPEQGVRFSGTADPLRCPAMPACSSNDETPLAKRRYGKAPIKSKRRGLRRGSRR